MSSTSTNQERTGQTHINCRDLPGTVKALGPLIANCREPVITPLLNDLLTLEDTRKMSASFCFISNNGTYEAWLDEKRPYLRPLRNGCSMSPIAFVRAAVSATLASIRKESRLAFFQILTDRIEQEHVELRLTVAMALLMLENIPYLPFGLIEPVMLRSLSINDTSHLKCRLVRYWGEEPNAVFSTIALRMFKDCNVPEARNRLEIIKKLFQDVDSALQKADDTRQGDFRETLIGQLLEELAVRTIKACCHAGRTMGILALEL